MKITTPGVTGTLAFAFSQGLRVKEEVSTFIATCEYESMVTRFPLSLLFSGLSKPRSLSLYSYKTLACPLVVFVAFLWTLSAVSTSLCTAGTKSELIIRAII